MRYFSIDYASFTSFPVVWRTVGDLKRFGQLVRGRLPRHIAAKCTMVACTRSESLCMRLRCVKARFVFTSFSIEAFGTYVSSNIITKFSYYGPDFGHLRGVVWSSPAILCSERLRTRNKTIPYMSSHLCARHVLAKNSGARSWMEMDRIQFGTGLTCVLADRFSRSSSTFFKRSGHMQHSYGTLVHRHLTPLIGILYSSTKGVRTFPQQAYDGEVLIPRRYVLRVEFCFGTPTNKHCSAVRSEFFNRFLWRVQDSHVPSPSSRISERMYYLWESHRSPANYTSFVPCRLKTNSAPSYFTV